MKIGMRHHNLRMLWTVAALATAFMFAAPRPAQATLAENVYDWAWSGSIGWISMNNCNQIGSCGPTDYGVTLVDVEGQEGWADLYGWAWSETIGWICFGQTCSGTTPEGVAPYAQFRDDYNGKEDNIYGWAKIDSLGNDGWISLNCENLNECGASNYHTVIDPDSGQFTKGMFADHWAWGGTEFVEGAGWLDFSSVVTTWTVSSLGDIRRPEGVFEPFDSNARGTHLFDLTVDFIGMSAVEDFLLECDIRRPDNSLLVMQKIMTETVRGGDESVTYTIQPGESVEENKLWIMEACRIGGYLTSTACTTNAECTPFQFCDETNGFCRIKVREKVRKWPIFTHSNTWTGLDADEDQYDALRCHSGFPGNYFNNAANCDFPGDASFSLLMRRGVPVEGYCHDGIDNDGNGETDCADRYCQGISYRCQTLPRTFCVWGATGDNLIDCTDPTYETGELCCSKQSRSATETDQQHIVNGLECAYGDPKDGYFDCDCTTTGRFDESPTDDCFAPGYTSGDLCCTQNNDVVIE